MVPGTKKGANVAPPIPANVAATGATTNVPTPGVNWLALASAALTSASCFSLLCSCYHCACSLNVLSTSAFLAIGAASSLAYLSANDSPVK